MANWTQTTRNRAVTVTTRFTTDEQVETPDGVVAVVVRDLFGTTVDSGSADVNADSDVCSYRVPAQTSLRPLQVTWACTVDGETRTQKSYIEVSGEYSFELTELRADSQLSDTERFPTEALRLARWYAESRVEDYLGYCIVPRYFHVIVDGGRPAFQGRSADLPSRELLLPVVNLRAPLTSLEVDGEAVDVDGVIVYPSKVVAPTPVFLAGYANVTVEGEQGDDYPQGDVYKAVVRLARHYLLTDQAVTPDRTNTMTTEWGTTQLGTATGGAVAVVRGHAGAPTAVKPTGLPDVDSVLIERSRRLPGMAF